ncbi:CmpA/NrtA family ABC transporter substrate-binding protein [Phragmitibacter flavus]|nr:CmpA/NrtA family ABC transporter substrate-binding protein [Phragmitibacter flavus]
MTASRHKPVRIGFIALTDCAPLLVADALGLFVKQGVEVELSLEIGWATVREKILYGQLDAAHSIVGLGLPLRLQQNGISCPAIVPFVFSLNGNAITLSMDMWRRGVRDAASFAKLIRSTPQRLFTLGIVAQTSSHNFLMRRWLMSGGIDPNKDVRLVVLPPTQMVGALSAGLIDGFCVSDPWNSLAVSRGVGWCPVISEDLMPGHPDKVLVTTETFADERKVEHDGVLRALYESCVFCDKISNREQVVEIILSSGYLRASREILRAALVGPFDNGVKPREDVESFYIFHRDGANQPTHSKGAWLLNEFLAHGLIPPGMRELAAIEVKKCYRPDLYHAAIDDMAATTKPVVKKRKLQTT